MQRPILPKMTKNYPDHQPGKMPNFDQNDSFWNILIKNPSKAFFEILIKISEILNFEIFDLGNDPFLSHFRVQNFEKSEKFCKNFSKNFWKFSKILASKIFEAKISKMKFCLHSRPYFRRRRVPKNRLFQASSRARQLLKMTRGLIGSFWIWPTSSGSCSPS